MYAVAFVDTCIHELTLFVDDDSTGYYVQATIISGDLGEPPIPNDDVLGPVLTVLPYEDDQWQYALTQVDSASVAALAGSMCVDVFGAACPII